MRRRFIFYARPNNNNNDDEDDDDTTHKECATNEFLLRVLDFQLVETFTFLCGSGSFWPERVHDGVRDGGTGMNAPREEHDEFRREMNGVRAERGQLDGHLRDGLDW